MQLSETEQEHLSGLLDVDLPFAHEPPPSWEVRAWLRYPEYYRLHHKRVLYHWEMVRDYVERAKILGYITEVFEVTKRRVQV